MASKKDNKRKHGDVSNAFANLQEVLASEEKALKEREEAFEKRLRLFEQEYPQSGDGSESDRDVIHLNVGGSTHVAVLRRTLTHFEHSMLASKFSGRWDDSLEKDKDGNFFIDENPEQFMKLIHYLRKLDKRKRLDINTPAPLAEHDFCWMLEYYDLMLSIYPQRWNLVWGTESKVTEPANPNDPYVIETSHLMCAFSLDLDKNEQNKPANAASFTVTFEKGTVGQIGWSSTKMSPNVKVGMAGNQSLALDLEGRSWYENGTSVASNLDVSTREREVTIRCTFNMELSKYTVHVVGSDPEICKERKGSGLWAPYISLIGKASISELSYSY